MAKSAPRAVILDLDGTLVDSAIAITQALNSLRARRGGAPLGKERTRAWVSLGATRLVALALGDLACDAEADVSEFRDIYRAIPAHPGDLFPGAGEMVEALTASGHALAICSNKPEDLARRVLDGVGLAPAFKALVGGRKDRPAKPHPAPLFAVLDALDATAESAVYAGDSEVDAQAAAAAGIPFLLATFGYPIGALAAIPRVASFDSLAELPDLLDSLPDD